MPLSPQANAFAIAVDGCLELLTEAQVLLSYKNIFSIVFNMIIQIQLLPGKANESETTINSTYF